MIYFSHELSLFSKTISNYDCIQEEYKHVFAATFSVAAVMYLYPEH